MLETQPPLPPPPTPSRALETQSLKPSIPGNQGPAQLSVEIEQVSIFCLPLGITWGHSIPPDFIFAAKPKSFSEPDGGGLRR